MPDQYETEAMAAMGGGPPSDSQPETAPVESSETADYEGELCINRRDLPEGMEPKAGDVLPFRVTSFGEDGEIYVSFADKSTGESDESGPKWEEDFRKEMSPRNPETSPSTGAEEMA